MDLYKPYYNLMGSLFKNAVLIADRFHIVIQARNALDNTRVKLCNKSNHNYKKLKKHWKLILKKECDLDNSYVKYVIRGNIDKSSDSVYSISSDGKIYESETNIELGIRPIFTLKSNLVFYGDGTKENPYKIKEK